MRCSVFAYRKVRPIKQKTLRRDAHSREGKGVACATALGARVSQAKLFFIETAVSILFLCTLLMKEMAVFLRMLLRIELMSERHGLIVEIGIRHLILW